MKSVFILLLFIGICLIPMVFAWFYSRRFTAQNTLEELRSGRLKIQCAFLATCLVHPLLQPVAELIGFPKGHLFFENAVKMLFGDIFPSGLTILLLYIASVVFAAFLTFRLDQKLDRLQRPTEKIVPISLKKVIITLLLPTLHIFVFFTFLIIYKITYEENTFLLDVVVAVLLYIFVLFLQQAASPLLMKLFFNLTPLPPSDLHDRLTKLMEKSMLPSMPMFRMSDSASQVANAWITGILPFYRVIIFSDLLLERFSDEEIEAILAHEIGHGKNKHLIWYFYFAIGYFSFAIGVNAFFTFLNVKFELISGSPLAILESLTAFIFILFFLLIRNFYSKILESEADYAVVELTGSGVAMISALTKLTEINAQTMRYKWWQKILSSHDDLEERSLMLRDKKRPIVKKHHRLAPLFMFLIGVLLITNFYSVFDSREAGYADYSVGFEFFSTGKYQEALTKLNSAIASNPEQALYLRLKGLLLLKMEKFAEAESIFRQIISSNDDYFYLYQLLIIADKRNDQTTYSEIVQKLEKIELSVHPKQWICLTDFYHLWKNKLEFDLPGLCAKWKIGRFLNLNHVATSAFRVGIDATDLKGMVDSHCDGKQSRILDCDQGHARIITTNQIFQTAEIELIAMDNSLLTSEVVLSTDEIKLLLKSTLIRQKFTGTIPVFLYPLK